nr:hypothetical protein Q903MT_gene249 [Picea sitchensis]
MWSLSSRLVTRAFFLAYEGDNELSHMFIQWPCDGIAHIGVTHSVDHSAVP